MGQSAEQDALKLCGLARITSAEIVLLSATRKQHRVKIVRVRKEVGITITFNMAIGDAEATFAHANVVSKCVQNSEDR